MTYDQLCDTWQEQEWRERVARAEAQIEEAKRSPARFVVWQLSTSPASIVGTLSADRMTTAAAMARARHGSFMVATWDGATRAEREQAIAADDAERIAAGVVCSECGEVLDTRQGQPTTCTECGGSAPTRDIVEARGAGWFHSSDGRYFASDAERQSYQAALDAKAARLADRIRRVEARAHLVDARALRAAS